MNILIAGLPENTKNYEIALRKCGASCSVHLSMGNVSAYDGLLLPGGGDLHPAWYGQKIHGSRSIDPELDRAQLLLLDAFVHAQKPVLGICRGLQVIQVYFGGNLVQDLPAAAKHQALPIPDSRKSSDQHHFVTNLPGTRLHTLYGDQCLVNSAHHQGILTPAPGLRPSQLAPDGVIEALEHTGKPVLGVQWHPERTGSIIPYPGIADGSILIHNFLKQM
jgi:putative glutamine amidotransferase